MIRHEYTGYGKPPGPPQLPREFESSHPEASGTKFVIPREPLKHTLNPYVTGSSVIGIKYKDGILLAADTMGSYGRTMRYKSVERMSAVGTSTIIGASGEISDFQYINTLLEELTTEDYTFDDGHTLTTPEIHSYLTRVMYNRRNKFDPLWNSLVVGGVGKDGEPYLGMVSMIGVQYVDSHVVTGFANYLSRPLLRNEHHDDMTEEEGIKLLEKCMRVLYYRDSSALNKIQIAKVTSAGVEISQPYSLTTEWSYSFFKNPTKNSQGSW